MNGGKVIGGGELIRKFYLAIGVVALAPLLLLILPMNPVTRYQAERVAEAYYYNLAKGQFAKAFHYVGYFDEASDWLPKITFEKAQQIWVNRVKELKEQGTYLAKVKQIRVYIDDGYPQGMADVVIINDGNPINLTEWIAFGRLNNKWKVQNATPLDGSRPLQLHEARSGYVGN